MPTLDFRIDRSTVVLLSLFLALTRARSASADAYSYAPVAGTLNTPTGKQLKARITLAGQSRDTTGSIRFVAPDGSTVATEAFTLTAGQPFSPSAVPNRQVSAVVQSNYAVAGVVQLENTAGVATMGAYSFNQAPAIAASVPLVVRELDTASGRANSQIVVQAGAGRGIVADVTLQGQGRTVVRRFNLPAGASVVYELRSETGLPVGWNGSAKVVSDSGPLSVTASHYLGAHGVQTVEGFTRGQTSWVAPLVTSRLANGLSTPVSTQNLSDQAIQAGELSLACSGAAGTFTLTNNSAVTPGSAFHFNPVTNRAFPDQWYGECALSSSQAIVAFVQMRIVGGDNAAAYEAIPASEASSDRVVFPVVAKKTSSNPGDFASAVTVRNLGRVDTETSFRYDPAPGYEHLGSHDLAVTIPANGVVIHNHRIASGDNSVPELPDGWRGVLTVTSLRTRIDGFAQLQYKNQPGDTFMAYRGSPAPRLVDVQTPFHATAETLADWCAPDHWKPWNGDWSSDIWRDNGAAGIGAHPNPTCGQDVHLRVSPSTFPGSSVPERLRAKVVNVSSHPYACASQVYSQGGYQQAFEVYATYSGVETLLGWVLFAHIDNRVYQYGDWIEDPRDVRIGTVFRGDTFTGCWGSCHLHMELRNEWGYSCYENICQAPFSGLSQASVVGKLGGRLGATQRCPR